MIGKAIRSRNGIGAGGSDFRGAVAYVTRKASAVWMVSLAEGPSEWRQAAEVMKVAASLNPRCGKPVYHLVLTWPVSEPPSPDEAHVAGREMLERFGAGDHQAVMGLHEDREHTHLHIILNLVDPVNGRRLSTSHDFARIEAACRAIELRHGWTPDNGRFDMQVGEEGGKPVVRLVPKSAAVWEERTRERAAGRRRPATARERGASGADQPLAEVMPPHLRQAVVRICTEACSWGELHARLRPLGLAYVRHGSGARLVLRGTSAFLSPSHLGTVIGWKRLAARLGTFKPGGNLLSPRLPRSPTEPDSGAISAAAPSVMRLSARRKRRTLERWYAGIHRDPAAAAAIRWIGLDERPPRVLFRDGVEVRDEGERVTGTGNTSPARRAMIALARAKGWRAIRLEGSPQFRAAIAREAAVAGLAVVDPLAEVANEDRENPPGRRQHCAPDPGDLDTTMVRRPGSSRTGRWAVDPDPGPPDDPSSAPTSPSDPAEPEPSP